MLKYPLTNDLDISAAYHLVFGILLVFICWVKANKCNPYHTINVARLLYDVTHPI